MRITCDFVARRQAHIQQQQFAQLAYNILPAVEMLGLMYAERDKAELLRRYLDSLYDEIGNPIRVPYPW